MSTKIYLSVPFERKEDAKSLGAKWDKDKKQWYTNAYNIQLIEKYPLSAPITELHGEKRDFEGSNLFVDLVPESCWFNNARTCIDSSDWDRLRNFIYARAGYMCECCQSKQNLEAHERWHFNEELRIQKLMRIIALCKQCHEVTHIGLAKVRGRFDIALRHLMKVTKMTLEQANCHIDKAFAVWELRNQHEWSLDLSILTNSGIKLSKLESKTKSSDFNNFYYQGDIIINLDEPDLSIPKQQIINHKPKIDNNKFKFLPSTDKQVSKVGLMVNKIKILVERIKMIIQPAKVNLSIKNSSKHYSNDWILQEIFLQLKQLSIFSTPTSIQNKLDNLIDLVTDGILTREEFLHKKNKLKERQYELSDLLKSYDRVDDKFSKKLIGLINISSQAYETFKSSTVNEKRELLNFIFANLELKGRKLCYTLAFPFSEFEKINNCTTWRE